MLHCGEVVSGPGAGKKDEHMGHGGGHEGHGH
jgi:hypothetical protein